MLFALGAPVCQLLAAIHFDGFLHDVVRDVVSAVLTFIDIDHAVTNRG